MKNNLLADGPIIFLQGEICFETIESLLLLWEAVKKDFTHERMIVNCKEITKGDSSLIALLVEMRRWAEQRAYAWELACYPSSLEGFLSTYGVTELLLTSTSPRAL